MIRMSLSFFLLVDVPLMISKSETLEAGLSSPSKNSTSDMPLMLCDDGTGVRVGIFPFRVRTFCHSGPSWKLGGLEVGGGGVG